MNVNVLMALELLFQLFLKHSDHSMFINTNNAIETPSQQLLWFLLRVGEGRILCFG